MFLKHYAVQTGKDVLIRFPKRVLALGGYLGEFARFRKLSRHRGFPVKYSDAYPNLKDRLATTPIDQHYILHPAWAARILAQERPAHHVDIASKLAFSTIVSAFIPTKFLDYRPAHLALPGYESGFGDLNKLDFDDNSVPSLSCMHTIEHIGLGRYGDTMDADGDLKAIAELKRVLAPGGSLLFVTPVGRKRIEFNAHRIYSYEQIMEYFAPLRLMQFSLIPDEGGLIWDADPALVARQEYGCGCFWFKKEL